MAPRNRHQGPKWAEGYADTPEGMDSLHVEREVRRHMHNATDPDEIDDDDVRDAYLQRLQEEAAADDDAREKRPHRVDPRSKGGARAGRASRPARGSTASRFSHPLHWGSGSRGHIVGKPSLSPGRLSVADGTGFAFGVLIYALGLSYIRYGIDGPKSWLSAKFINKPTLSPAAAANPDPTLLRLLTPPGIGRKPIVAPAPTYTPPGSLGPIWQQPGAKP